MGTQKEKLLSFLKKHGGTATFSTILNAGFHKATLKSLIDKNQIEKTDRALYRLKGGSALSNPDLVTAALKVPKGVICLLSALVFHEATDEIPRYIELAIPRGSHANKIDYPPIRYHRFAPQAWQTGIEEHKTDGYVIRVYSLAKTVADCFKFRNKIGTQVARLALKEAVTVRGISPSEIVQFAKICRVDRIVKPIVETLI